MKEYKFTTSTGKAVTLTAGDVKYKQEITLDGQQTGVYDENTSLVVKSLEIEGVGTFSNANVHKDLTVKGKHIGKAVSVRHSGRNIIVPVPDEIFDDLYAGQAKREETTLEELAQARKSEKKETRAACPKCGTWCYGDCEA